jgi:beta-xylosidase
MGGAGGQVAAGGAAARGGITGNGGTSPMGGTLSTGGARATGGATASGGTVGTGGTTNPGTCPATFKNPIIYQDLPDNEVIRVDNAYYYSASSFHFSPGAPILRSYDLVNWEYIGHSVPALESNYNLGGNRQYNNGVWASSLKYRKSNKTFYWMGCLHGTGQGLMYTATNIEGPWTRHTTSYCYYDVGLLIDEDTDTMYAAYGNTAISVAQLSADGFSQVKSQNVYTSGSEGALEGSRFYKIDGSYYIMPTQYSNGEYMLKAASPFGPYTLQSFAVKLKSPIPAEPPVGGAPHQGSIVQTQNGDWYYMAFIDAYPGGRIPVLGPVTWSNGVAQVTLVSGGWGQSYPFPNLPCTPTKPFTGTDSFAGATLDHQWEWNHNPDNTKWSAGGGLTLQTATVTDDLYAARNTLTRRVLGPTSTATIELDYTGMSDGDVAGLSIFRQTSAWIGVKKSGGSAKVVMVNGLTMTSSFATQSKGTEQASASISGGKIWLRATADVTPGQNRKASFSYSTDGTQFTALGNTLTLDHTWAFFMGYRFAIFNYATQALGGFIKVPSFSITQP